MLNLEAGVSSTQKSLCCRQKLFSVADRSRCAADISCLVLQTEVAVLHR